LKFKRYQRSTITIFPNNEQPSPINHFSEQRTTININHFPNNEQRTTIVGGCKAQFGQSELFQENLLCF
jgi:hypothetical protein